MKIEEMDLSVRSYNCLKRVGIDTIEQLSEKTEDDLRRIRNLGKQSIGEIIRAMEVRGYVLKAEDPLDAGTCVTCGDIKEQAQNYQALYSKAAQERDAAVEKLKGTVPLCEKLEQMIISAERYAFGRRTYIVSDTCSYIGGLLPRLSDWCLSILGQDIESELKRAERIGSFEYWGDECDRKQWATFWKKLTEEIERRIRDGKSDYLRRQPWSDQLHDRSIHGMRPEQGGGGVPADAG